MWQNTVVASGTALGLIIYTGRETRSAVPVKANRISGISSGRLVRLQSLDPWPRASNSFNSLLQAPLRVEPLKFT